MFKRLCVENVHGWTLSARAVGPRGEAALQLCNAHDLLPIAKNNHRWLSAASSSFHESPSHAPAKVTPFLLKYHSHAAQSVPSLNGWEITPGTGTRAPPLPAGVSLPRMGLR